MVNFILCEAYVKITELEGQCNLHQNKDTMVQSWYSFISKCLVSIFNIVVTGTCAKMIKRWKLEPQKLGYSKRSVLLNN